MDISDRIAAAEQDLNAALEHAQDLAIARQQVRDALDDLRVYRNLLALAPYGVPRETADLPIPPQERRRVGPAANPRPLDPPARRAVVRIVDVRALAKPSRQPKPRRRT